MEPRQEDSKRIKPNLRSKICARERVKVVSSSFMVSRLAYPVQREVNYYGSEIKAIKKRMRSINMNLKHLLSVQKLNLHLPKEATDMDFNEIGQTLNKLISLQSLALDCFWCRQITDQAFYYLSPGLKRLSLLKSIEISLYSNKITDESLNTLGKSLQKLVCLEKLKLTLYSCSKIADSGVSRFTANLKNLLSLKNLSIFVAGTSIKERGILDICDTIKRLTCIHALSLYFASQQKMITDTVLRRLGGALESLASLRSLDLNLCIHEETTDLGLQELSKGLSKLARLQKLSAKFYGSVSSKELGDQGFLYFSEALGRMTHLQVLNIDFNCSGTEFTNQGLFHMSKGLEQLKNLEKIKLTFKDTWNITDQGLGILGKGLGRLALLQEIKMDLSNLEKVTDSAGKNFCSSLKNLSNLKEFELVIEQCLNFTGAGMHMTCQILKDLPSLQTIRYQYDDDYLYLNGKDKFLEALEDPVTFFSYAPNNFNQKEFNQCESENSEERNLDNKEPEVIESKNGKKTSNSTGCEIF